MTSSDCVPDTRYLSSPHFLATALHCLVCIEVPILSFGAYCILFKTPAQMSAVKWLMLNLHFWSSLSDVFLSLFGIPFILLPVPAGYGLGLINSPGFLIYCCITLVTALTTSVLAIYENRYNLLRGRYTRWRVVRKPFLFFVYSLVPMFFLPPYLNLPDQQTARTLALAQLPCLPEFTYIERELFVLALNYRIPLMSVAASTLVLATLILLFCMLTAYHIHQIRLNSWYSIRTCKMHWQFVYALTVQSVYMLLVILAPVLTALAIVLLWHHDQTLNNFVIITLSLHGVCSTIVMIMVHRPYRKFVFSKHIIQRNINPPSVVF
ncbi:unnamed protein product [Caenorhabditis sp. 36 PRJEB53466]|nr:unnamed protein product [Caenorhabditis sp. 36 PRJEB53466]